MENQTSEGVVMPDITDPLATKSEEDEANLGAEGHGGHPGHTTVSVAAVSAVSAVEAVTVQSGVSVGSLINVTSGGTTFNVITPDQLQLSGAGHLRPILCVDNSCLCDGNQDKDSDSHRTHWFRENGHLKTAHIVIENASEESLPSNTSASWMEAASLPVLPVRCKNTSAELHKSRFGSGGRGRCIKLGMQWYTPSEFEALCGRGSSKDWKRSIRFGGRSLLSLIDEGILHPHATSCTCASCCDDERAMGPVRLFTPYKRRKRKDSELELSGMKRLKQSCKESQESSVGDESAEDSNPGSGEGCAVYRVANGAEGGGDTAVRLPAPGAPAPAPQEHALRIVEDPLYSASTSLNETFNKLDKMAAKLVKMVFQLRRDVDEAKNQWRAEREQLLYDHKRDKEQAVLTARVEAQVAASRAVFDSTVHVVDPITAVGLQPSEDSTESKKCANCNREAFAECSLCRRTPYCSTFCQRKDWGSHQVECVRSAAAASGATGDPADQSSSIMLIVESAPELGDQE